jgi:hypothetical protein
MKKRIGPDDGASFPYRSQTIPPKVVERWPATHEVKRKQRWRLHD